MKCKKCGRPMGSKNYCSYCEPNKKQKTPQRRWLIPTVIGSLCLIAAVIVVLVLVGGKQSKFGGKHHVEIEIRDYGTIAVELDADAAPITVRNFLDLASDGFYDGLTFHRIIKGFMMQGGDPNGNGTGGSKNTIKGEFSQNGVSNPLSHTRGAISMARSSGYNSASSQFFICHGDASASLDGQYACFGYVTSGMDVVDAICETAQPTDDNGTIPAAQQPVIEEIRVID